MQDGLTAIRERSDDAKRARILEGAYKVFLAYGFNRVTMDDIAKAAELSRPALYLVFRNKGDIYRAIARCVLARCADRAREELAGDGPLLDRMDRMVERAMFEMMREIESSPHGTEILDMKSSLAADVLEEWRGGMEQALAVEIGKEAMRNGVDLNSRGLSPEAMAQTYFDALEGMKPRFSDPNCHLQAAKSASRLLVSALRP